MGLQTAFLSGDSRGEPISLLFLASKGHLYSLDFVAYLPLSKPAVVVSSLLSYFSPPSYKDPSDYIGPTQMIQDNPYISRSFTSS